MIRFESGTALMPTIPREELLPRSQFSFITLEVDGVSDLPSDWYLRICGLASTTLKERRKLDEDLPRKKLLVDYWHSRPKKADRDNGGGSTTGPSTSFSASASGSGEWSGRSGTTHEEQVAQAFAAVPERSEDEPAPPPYSLTSETEAADPASSRTDSTTSTYIQSSSPSNPSLAVSNPGSDYLAQLTSTLGSVSLSPQPSSAVFNATPAAAPMSSPPILPGQISAEPQATTFLNGQFAGEYF